MGRFRADQKIGVEVDGRVGSTRAIHADWDAGVGVRLQIAVHAQRDGDVGISGQKDLPHRHGLQWLLRQMTKDGGRVQSDLRALGCSKRRRARRSVVAEHVVQRRLKVGVAEALYHDAVDLRNLSANRFRTFHAHDRADPDRRIERRPKMELVRCVGLALGRDDPAERHRADRRFRRRAHACNEVMGIELRNLLPCTPIKTRVLRLGYMQARRNSSQSRIP